MSYKPSSEVLPMVAVDPTAPIMLGEYAGRWAFLSALQQEAPAFWTELHRLRDDADAVASWMARRGVVDEWLVEICWSTVRHWKQEETKQLTPEPGRRMWRYPLLDEGRARMPLRPSARHELSKWFLGQKFAGSRLKQKSGSSSMPRLCGTRLLPKFGLFAMVCLESPTDCR